MWTCISYHLWLSHLFTVSKPQSIVSILDTIDWGRKWVVGFNTGKTQLVLFDQSNNFGAIDVKIDEPVFEEKSSFKMLGLCFSSKLDSGSYIISIAKTVFKKIEALICSMKFLSPEVALYLYKSTIETCMEHQLSCLDLWSYLLATWKY